LSTIIETVIRKYILDIFYSNSESAHIGVGVVRLAPPKDIYKPPKEFVRAGSEDHKKFVSLYRVTVTKPVSIEKRLVK